jgi:hypothetical protein
MLAHGVHYSRAEEGLLAESYPQMGSNFELFGGSKRIT